MRYVEYVCASVGSLYSKSKFGGGDEAGGGVGDGRYSGVYGVVEW